MEEPAPAPTGLVSKTVTHVLGADANHIEHVISSWHVNGWLLLGVVIAANLIGAIFHI